MEKIIIGYSGFVGSNLCSQVKFDGYFNSKNIQEAYDLNPDLCIYTGVRADKFIANENANADLEHIKDTINNIIRINPKFLILISTVDVYDNFENKNEDYVSSFEQLAPYGRNRLILEQWVENNISDYLIIRLPALFGKGLKKNFLYDYMHIIPFMIKETKFLEFIAKEPDLSGYYFLNSNGYFQCKTLDILDMEILKSLFLKLNFSAVNFTDSRNEYQFYNLNYLWTHIQLVRKLKIKKANFVTEPLSVHEVYESLAHHSFNNPLQNIPSFYCLKTKYDYIFNQNNGFIFNKDFVLNDIIDFIGESK